MWPVLQKNDTQLYLMLILLDLKKVKYACCKIYETERNIYPLRYDTTVKHDMYKLTNKNMTNKNNDKT